MSYIPNQIAIYYLFNAPSSKSILLLGDVRAHCSSVHLPHEDVDACSITAVESAVGQFGIGVILHAERTTAGRGLHQKGNASKQGSVEEELIVSDSAW